MTLKDDREKKEGESRSKQDSINDSQGTCITCQNKEVTETGKHPPYMYVYPLVNAGNWPTNQGLVGT